MTHESDFLSPLNRENRPKYCASYMPNNNFLKRHPSPSP